MPTAWLELLECRSGISTYPRLVPFQLCSEFQPAKKSGALFEITPSSSRYQVTLSSPGVSDLKQFGENSWNGARGLLPLSPHHGCGWPHPLWKGKSCRRRFCQSWLFSKWFALRHRRGYRAAPFRFLFLEAG